MTRRGIVLAGTVILDLVYLVDHWPVEESVSLINRMEYGAGGPPHNAAAGLVKLEAPFPVMLIGAVGDDDYGTIFSQQAEDYGLDVRGLVRVAGAVTSHTLVMTTETTGRRTFFHQVGVNAALSARQLMPPPEDRSAIFYLGAPGIARAMDEGGGWQQVLHAASARGYRTALELVPLAPERLRRHVPACLPHTDILVINDSEAAALTGCAVTVNGSFDAESAATACRALLALGVREVAAIHHPQGAVAVASGGETASAGSVKVPQSEIIGTVGAGDAFYAGMLLGLHEGWPLARCLQLANASAATSLHSATTSASIRPWPACLDYAEKHGTR